MWWAAPRPAGRYGAWTYEHIYYHDLRDAEDNLLGFVREDKRSGHEFTPHTFPAKNQAQFPVQATLEEAKALLVAHFVTLRLEE